MDTQIIKKLAIAKILGSLFEGTCQYSYLVKTAWNYPIEPDIKALDKFRIKLSHLAELHFENLLDLDDCFVVKDVIEFTRIVGSEYGHVTSSYTTGTWGVRHSTLHDILDVLNIPDYDLLPVTSPYKFYDLDCIIDSYEISKFNFWVKLHPTNGIANDFSIDFSWKDLAKVSIHAPRGGSDLVKIALLKSLLTIP